MKTREAMVRRLQEFLWLESASGLILMAVFFLLVGLELKREVLEGHLSSVRKALLPGFAAVGGMATLVGGLVVLNRAGVRRLTGYVLLGIPLWIAVLKSGVHATLAGVIVALFIPHGTTEDPQPREEEGSPLLQMEHGHSPGPGGDRRSLRRLRGAGERHRR